MNVLIAAFAAGWSHSERVVVVTEAGSHCRPVNSWQPLWTRSAKQQFFKAQCFSALPVFRSELVYSSETKVKSNPQICEKNI